MRCFQIRALTVVALTLVAASVTVAAATAAEPPAEFLRLGERALDYTRRVVEIGPRPAGSEGMRKQQKLILS